MPWTRDAIELETVFSANRKLSFILFSSDRYQILRARRSLQKELKFSWFPQKDGGDFSHKSKSTDKIEGVGG